MRFPKSRPYSLRTNPWGSLVDRILITALSAVEPEKALLEKATREGNILRVNDRTFDLSEIDQIYVIGAGKAVEPMALGIGKLLGDRISRGLVITKYGHATPDILPEVIRVLEAGHPIPDDRGIQATEKMLTLLESTHPDDLVICLISGGGSALLTAPMPGVTLSDLQDLTCALLACGATIHEINAVRKHLDRVKGGQLARIASPAAILTLVLSDVVGDDLDVIASGPTVPDPSSFEQALGILRRYDLLERVNPSIQKVLYDGMTGRLAETPKPGDPIFSKVSNVIIGSNNIAGAAATREAQNLGFNALLLTNFLQGEASQVGRVAAALLRQISKYGQPLPRPACLILGGETTVTLKGSGLGGRNLELALSAVEDLSGIGNIALVSLATDGGDGPTDAAGAIVTGETAPRARAADLRPSAFLKNNDSYHFFEKLEDLLITGPTRTNVNDLIFLFAF